MAISQRILRLFSLIKEKCIHEMEHFDWWKRATGHSLHIHDELLLNMKLLFGLLHYLNKSACFQMIHVCTLTQLE